jgi:hypothetical protein
MAGATSCDLSMNLFGMSRTPRFSYVLNRCATLPPAPNDTARKNRSINALSSSSIVMPHCPSDVDAAHGDARMQAGQTPATAPHSEDGTFNGNGINELMTGECASARQRTRYE